MTNRWQVRAHQSHKNGSKYPKCRWVVDPPGFDYKLRAEHTGNWHRAGCGRRVAGSYGHGTRRSETTSLVNL